MRSRRMTCKVCLGQRGFKFDDDPARDFVLQIERVAALDIVTPSPELVAGFRLDELHGDAHAALRGAHVAGHDIAHAKLVPRPAEPRSGPACSGATMRAR